VSLRMRSYQTDRNHYDLQLAYARPVIALLAALSLLELRRAREVERPLAFLLAYFIVAIVILLLENMLRQFQWHLPVLCDVLAACVFLYLSPEILPAWFVLFFVAFAAGYRWNLRFSLILMFGILLLAAALDMNRTLRAIHENAAATDSNYLVVCRVRLISIGYLLVAYLGAAGMAFLGDRSRRFAWQQDFLGQLSSTMHVEMGLAESLRLLLEEIAGEFQAEEVMLAFRDADLERIFLWRLKSGESERLIPENLPLGRADGLLLDDMEVSLCWNSMEGQGSGFGWDRRNGHTIKALPRVPGPMQQELGIRNFMSVAFEQEEKPAGRLFLINRRPGRAAYSKDDLRWFERIARQVSPSLENVFLLRHLRARAIEAERSRISRDLHDGILQTLLSIEMQLDVLRRRVGSHPEQTESDLAALRQTVKNEGAELRHMVTDLRPLRVQSADLVDLMRGFAERFRNESALALDLLVDSAELHAPDRVCREIFQIYREALNNIKKHAKASHVVVKLSQDDSRLALVVDDNGEGFSFAGRFTGDELDRLRLGPISIKERTRTVGGVLTVESNPGHGARLTIEVPLG
jgi:signal transduction histidine kinase